MGKRTRSPQRMLIPLVLAFWWGRDGKGKPQKQQLLDYQCVDLELEAQYRDVRRQLDEYDRSRAPEVRGRWNRVCGECGFVNHERHRFCESCGCTLTVEHTDVVHVCPCCNHVLGGHQVQCPQCGARFWSPIVEHRHRDADQSSEPSHDHDGGSV